MIIAIVVVWAVKDGKNPRSTAKASRPSISFVNIADGDRVGSQFDALVKTASIKLPKGAGNDPSVMPYVFQLDGGTYDTHSFTDFAAPSTASPFALGSGMQFSQNFQPFIRYSSIPPGKHRLVARVQRADGTLIPGVSAVVQIRVRANPTAKARRAATRVDGIGITYPHPGATVLSDFQAQAVVPSAFKLGISGSEGEAMPRRYLRWTLDNGRFDTPRNSSNTGLIPGKHVSATTNASVSYRGIPEGRHVLKVTFVDRQSRNNLSFTSEFFVQ